MLLSCKFFLHYVIGFLVQEHKITPEFLPTEVGRTAIFKCLSDGDGLWFFKSLTSIEFSKAKILRIKKVNITLTGNFYCYGKYFNKKLHFLAKATLKVYGK